MATPPNPVLVLLARLSELDALALCVWGEARNETPNGQIAVAQVVMHRRRAGLWGDTVNEVVGAKSQFSCFWPFGGQANYERVLDVARKLADGQDVPEMEQCDWVAQGVFHGRVTKDLARGAKHYMTTDLLQSGLAPKWAQTMQRVAVVDSHTFLKAIKG